ncbi:LysM peptidoglycan-binding domain-containing protein [Archangium violaceum]|uniref:LysM peptidoglycan-binding domain-containing protein n=1 Tax=Archangium violaceum TaxID=83451 RepID=UPI00193B2F84|nr:LysM domain-containing protein [Archangium violaceum]QRK04075.1 LysM peptidoglycan-binding domain-containing protein [Archangium violaceum]
MPKTHKVQQGDTLTSIAEKYGFVDDWQALYQAPENAALRKKRPNPMLIYPGDEVAIPARPPTRVQGVTGGPQKFQRQPADGLGLIKRARQLSAEYIRLRDKYMTWVSDKERASWFSIAEWTRSLVSQDADAYGSRANKARLEKFQEDYEKEAQPQREAYESKCRELVNLMLIQSFKRQFDTLADEDRAQCYADLTEAFNESNVGRTFILQELKKAEKSDPSALLTGVFKIMKEANGAFWKWLAEFAPTIVRWKQEEALGYIEHLIIQRVRGISVDLLRKKVNLYETTTIVRVRQTFTITVLTPEHIRLNETPNAQRISGFLNKAFEAINLALALNELSKKQGTKEILSAVGAVAAMLEQFKSVTTVLTARKWMRVAGAGTEASVLAIITGVCDAVTGSMDAWDRASKGDYDAALLYGAGAAGGAAAAVGASLIVFGAGTSWTGVGVVVLLAGAIVSLGAALASVFGNFDDTALQLWVLNNRFGNDGDDPASEFREWKNNPTRQLEGLKDALALVEFEGSFSEERHQIVIKPSMVLTCSQVRMTIGAAWDLGGYQHWRNRLLDERSASLKLEGNRVTEITITVPQPPGQRKQVLYTELRVEMLVDAYNDGKTMTYKRSAKLSPSVTERIRSWF